MPQKPSDRITEIYKDRLAAVPSFSSKGNAIGEAIMSLHDFLDEYAASVKSAIIESANKARFPVTCSYNHDDRDAIDADTFIKSLQELL